MKLIDLLLDIDSSVEDEVGDEHNHDNDGDSGHNCGKILIINLRMKGPVTKLKNLPDVQSIVWGAIKIVWCQTT